MKRPLCLLAILLSAAVCIYLELFLSDITGEVPEDLDGSYVSVVGRVQSKEVRKDYQGEYLPVIYIVPTMQEYKHSNLIQCYLESGDVSLPVIGEYVEMRGRIKTFSPPTNPGEFDSRLYYSTLKISYRLTGARVLKTGGKPNRYRESLYTVRLFFERSLDRVLEPQDSAIMKAMLLGDKAFMDDETKDMYKRGGIMHILAVSGLHISIIGMGLYEILKKLRMNRGIATIIPILFMYSYGIMCGMGTSSFRAICMFVIRLMAPVFGRTYDVLTGLALAEILLLMDQPLYMYNSGFLFSFGAVAGISVVKPSLDSPYLREYLGGRRMKFTDDQISFAKELSLKAIDGLKSGAGVMLATLPVYACFYYTYPLHSLALNLLVIPVMGMLMMLGIVVMLIGAVSPLLGSIPGLFVHVILAFYRLLCSSQAVVSGFTWYMGHSDKWQVIAYLVLLTCFVLSAGTKWHPSHNDIPLIRQDVIRMALLLWAVLILTFHHNPGLAIDMIDVGQGDGIVISSGGKHMLIDGGSTSKKNVGKYQIIPFLKYKGIGKLDYVVLTHEDEDHMSGILEAMDDMKKGGVAIKHMILPEIAEISKGDNYHLIETRAKELKIPVSYINTGESFSLGNADFTCLGPVKGMTTDGANEYSTVLFMKYGQFTALFTGDVEGMGQENLKSVIANNPESFENLTILKVAHHGSMYTTDMDFLKQIQPKVALISCGEDNSYGHPHKELLDRLEDVEASVYRTDQSGEISLRIDKNVVKLISYQ